MTNPVFLDTETTGLRPDRHDADERTAMALDPMARIIFGIALRDRQAGKLLWHLFGGGGVTVDLGTRHLVYLPASQGAGR